MLATPGMLWPNQSLPAAFRSCTGSPYEPQPSLLRDICRASALSGSLRGLFRHRSGDSSGASALLAGPFEPHGTWTYVWAFYVTTAKRDRHRSVAASQVSSQPLIHSGWIRTPWAPSACPRLSRPSRPSVAGRTFR